MKLSAVAVVLPAGGVSCSNAPSGTPHESRSPIIQRTCTPSTWMHALTNSLRTGDTAWHTSFECYAHHGQSTPTLSSTPSTGEAYTVAGTLSTPKKSTGTPEGIEAQKTSIGRHQPRCQEVKAAFSDVELDEKSRFCRRLQLTGIHLRQSEWKIFAQMVDLPA